MRARFSIAFTENRTGKSIFSYSFWAITLKLSGYVQGTIYKLLVFLEFWFRPLKWNKSIFRILICLYQKQLKSRWRPPPPPPPPPPLRAIACWYYQFSWCMAIGKIKKDLKPWGFRTCLSWFVTHALQCQSTFLDVKYINLTFASKCMRGEAKSLAAGFASLWFDLTLQDEVMGTVREGTLARGGRDRLGVWGHVVSITLRFSCRYSGSFWYYRYNWNLKMSEFPKH